MRALKFNGLHHPQFSKISVLGQAERISYQQKNHSEPENFPFLNGWLKR